MTDIAKVRDALHALYAQALGHDYANEHETRGWFVLVDDALDELERRLPQAISDETKE